MADVQENSGGSLGGRLQGFAADDQGVNVITGTAGRVGVSKIATGVCGVITENSRTCDVIGDVHRGTFQKEFESRLKVSVSVGNRNLFPKSLFHWSGIFAVLCRFSAYSNWTSPILIVLSFCSHIKNAK